MSRMIIEMREKRKLTREEVASKLGILVEEYEEYELGLRKIPHELKLKIIKLFDI